MRVDWTNIQISGKELIAVVAFVFSMSGIYYKLFYNNDMQRTMVENYIKVSDARMDALEINQKTQSKIFEAQIQMLTDDYKVRKAIDDYKKSTEFVPLKQK